MSRRLIWRRVAMRDRRWAAIGLAVAIYLLSPGPALPAEFRPLPTQGEARIRKALDQKTELAFNEQPLSDVVAAISAAHEIEVQLDIKALEDGGIGSDTPITRQVKDVSLRSALGLLLSELDLTYVVRNGYLLITTKAEAEALIVVKAYPVGDLLGSDDGLCSPLAPGGKAGAVSDDFEHLIGVITGTVAPTTWDEVGGPGTIQEVRQSDALAVGQVEEAHQGIAEVLDAMRVVRDKQLKAAEALAAEPPKDQEVAEPEMRLTSYRILPDPMTAKPLAKQPKPVANVGDAAGADQPAPPAAPAPPGAAGAMPDPGSEYIAEDRLAAKVAKITSLLPELIEPETWQPHGAGMARAVDDTIVVRQTEEVQRRVAALLTEMAPGRVLYWRRVAGPPRLAVPGPQANWPQQAEPLAEREAAIERTLERSADIDVADMPLADAIAKIKQEYELPIQLDAKALEDEGIGSDTPISRQIHGIPLRALLHLMLSELDLTYVIRHEVVIVTTKAEAESLLTTKVYPIFDLACLARGKGEGAGPAQWAKMVLPHGFLGAARPQRRDHTGVDYASLINGITGSIAPTTWDEVGGPGTITEFAPAGALVISQTTEVHEEIAEYLKALRDVAK
jgi:hypothetical protein